MGVYLCVHVLCVCTNVSVCVCVCMYVCVCCMNVIGSNTKGQTCVYVSVLLYYHSCSYIASGLAMLMSHNSNTFSTHFLQI